MQPDKKRQSMKNFLEMRRQKAKNIKAFAGTINQLNQFLVQSNLVGFQELLSKQEANNIQSYLLSQDELLKSPIMLALESPECIKFLNVISKYSKEILQKEKEKLGSDDNISYFLKSKFQGIIKSLCKRVQSQWKQIIITFSEKGTILSNFMAMFLNYQNIVGVIPEERKLELIEGLFLKMSQNLGLEEKELENYTFVTKKDKLWANKNFIDYLHSPQFLNLNELNYNFMHELTRTNQEPQIYQIIEKINEEISNSDDSKADESTRQPIFCSFDNSNDTPTDIILSKWAYPSINKFLSYIKDSNWILFSVNTLNKILHNTNLSQAQTQSLLEYFCAPSMNERGLSERVLSDQHTKHRGKDHIIVREKNEYIIVLGKRRMIMAKDRRECFPLYGYLDRFGDKCSLKIISELFLPTLDRREVKRNIISAMKNIGPQTRTFQNNTQAIKQLSETIYYHQSLILFLPKLSSTEILHFFIDKLYINYSIISISNLADKIKISMASVHFLVLFLETHENLQENEVNIKIIQKVFESKEKERIIGEYNLYVEILKQLHFREALVKKQGWMVQKTLEILKKYFKEFDTNALHETKTYFEYGNQIKQITVADILWPVFTLQELSQMKIQGRTETVREILKKKLKNEKKQFKQSRRIMQNRSNRNNLEAFTETVKEQMEAFEKIKEEAQNAKDLTILSAVYARPSFLLSIDQQKLEQKIEILVQYKLPVSFKKQRFLYVFSHLPDKFQAIVESLSETYKIAIKLLSEHNFMWQNDQKSFSISDILLFCQNKDVQTAMNFLLSQASEKKILFNRIRSRYTINPFLLHQIIKHDIEKGELVELEIQELRNMINSGVKQVTNSFKNNSKGIQNHESVMITYLQIIQSVQTHKHKLKCHQPILEYLKLHPKTLNCQNFIKAIQPSFVFNSLNIEVYWIVLSFGDKPFDLLRSIKTKVDQQIYKLEKENATLTEQQKENLSDEYGIQDYKKFKPLSSKTYNHSIQKSKNIFYTFLSSLSPSQFQQFLSTSPPEQFLEYRQIIQNLTNQQKCLTTLSHLLASNKEIPIKMFIYLFRPKFERLNSALSVFVDLNSIANLAANKSTTGKQFQEVKVFVANLDSQNYAIFLQHVVKMVKISDDFLNQFEKSSKLTKILQTLIHYWKWDKITLFLDILTKYSQKHLQEILSKRKQYHQFTTKIIAENQDCGLEKKIDFLERFIYEALCLFSSNQTKQTSIESSYLESEGNLFLLLKSNQIENNEGIFIKAWILNPEKCLQSIKINSISCSGISQCLYHHPKYFKLITNLTITSNPQNSKPYWKPLQAAVPLSNYSAVNFQEQPHLIDVLLFQQNRIHPLLEKTKKISEGIELFYKKKQTLFLNKQCMKRYKEMFSKQQIEKGCIQIFNSNVLSSLSQVPNEYVSVYFQKHENVMGLQNLKESLIKQLIDLGHVKNSEFMSIIKACNFNVTDYFIEKTNIPMYDFVMKFEDQHNQIGRFVEILVSLENQQFVSLFIPKFKIFQFYKDDYKFQKMTQSLLWNIAFFKRTQVLKVLIDHLHERYENQIKYQIAPIFSQLLPDQSASYQNLTKSSQDCSVKNGKVYLPLKVASVNNFYEYYFLLLQSKMSEVEPFINQTLANTISQNLIFKENNILFKRSTRFLNDCQPQNYSFIPIMKRRLEVYQVVSEYIQDNNFTSIGTDQLQRKGLILQACFGFTIGNEKVLKKNNHFFDFVQRLTEDSIHILPPSNQTKNLNNYELILFFSTLPNFIIPEGKFLLILPIEAKFVAFVLNSLAIEVKGHENIMQILTNPNLNEKMGEVIFLSHPKLVIQMFNYLQKNQSAQEFSRQVTRFFEQFSSILAQHIPLFEQESNIMFSKRVKQVLIKLSEQNIALLAIKNFFIACIMSKYESQNIFINLFCQIRNNISHEELLLQFAFSLCNQYIPQKYEQLEGNKYSIKQMKVSANKIRLFHNPAFWHSVTQILKKINEQYPFKSAAKFTQYLTPQSQSKFCSFFQIHQVRHLLQQVIENLYDVVACVSYLSSLIHLICERNYVWQICEQHNVEKNVVGISDKNNIKETSEKKVEKDESFELLELGQLDHFLNIEVNFGSSARVEEIAQSDKVFDLKIQIPVEVIETEAGIERVLKIQTGQTIIKLELFFYFRQVKWNPLIFDCLGQINISFNIQSLKACTDLPLLFKIINANKLLPLNSTAKQKDSHSTYSLKSTSSQITDLIESLLSFVYGQQNRYTFSDVDGPIRINQNTQIDEVLELIGFYELLPLGDVKVELRYGEGIGEEWQKMVRDFGEYFKIIESQIHENEKPIPKYSNVLYVYPKPTDHQYPMLIPTSFYLYNILNLISSLSRYEKQIQYSLMNEIQVRYSIPSVVRLLENQILKGRTSNSVEKFIGELLGGERNYKFMESLLWMIVDDARNIMKQTKGILLSLTLEPAAPVKGTQSYHLTSTYSLSAVTYKRTPQILTIQLHLSETPATESKQAQSDNDVSKQISIKDSGLACLSRFLDSIFGTVQILTSYFFDKNELQNYLVKLSNSVSQLVNSTVTFSVNYAGLYSFVEKLKKHTSINNIQTLLKTLCVYTQHNIETYIMNYHVETKWQADRHLVQLMRYFTTQNTNKKVTNKSVNNFMMENNSYEFPHVYQRHMKFIVNLSSGVKFQQNEHNIKNVYLIQIYKSYFSSVVWEGMTCLIGYKNAHTPAIVQIKKKQDIDKIHINQVSFLLIVSKSIPTCDQIRYDKIVDIFVTDLNESLYLLSKQIKDKLLGLSEDSQERILAHMVPVLQSNVILIFDEDTNAHDEVKDDQFHKYVKILLNENGIYKFENKNRMVLSCVDRLKIDTRFDNLVNGFIQEISQYENNFQQICLTFSAPTELDPLKAIDLYDLTLSDFSSAFSLFYAKTISIFDHLASILMEESAKMTAVQKQKIKIWRKCVRQIHFQISNAEESGIALQNNVLTVTINLSLSSFKIDKMSILEKLSLIIIQEMQKQEQVKQVYEKCQWKHQSYCNVLNYLSVHKYQIFSIRRAIEIATSANILKQNISQIKIKILEQDKSQVSIQNQKLTLTVGCLKQHEGYFSVQQLLQYFQNHKIFQSTFQIVKLNTVKPALLFENLAQSKTITLISQNQKIQTEQIIIPQKQTTSVVNTANKGANSKSFSQVPIDPLKVNSKHKDFYIIQSNPTTSVSTVYSNYFYNTNSTTIPVLKQKTIKCPIKNPIVILLTHSCPINIHINPVYVQLQSPKNRKREVDLLSPQKQYQFDVFYVSLETIRIQIVPKMSCTLTFGSWSGENMKVLGKDGETLGQVALQCYSEKCMVEENTQFIGLIYKQKNIVQYKEEHEVKPLNFILSQPAQKIVMTQSKKEETGQNVQRMVFATNDKSLKFLTKAEQDRIDILNFYDEERNLVELPAESTIKFRHISSSVIVVPRIQRCELNNVHLIWAPTLRGTYEVILNSTRLNTSYEIGVHAASIDVAKCQIKIPQKKQLCYAEETEVVFQLKDRFDNIYTELEQKVGGKGVLIQINDISDDIEKINVQVVMDKIDKYGQKKVKICFDDPTNDKQRNVKIEFVLNKVKIAEAIFLVKGQALVQRHKNLQRAIDSDNKRSHKQFVINRNQFMKALFSTAAESNLNVRVSIKFYREQGIDAGGPKREFYDKIGNEMKDQKNKFFILTDSKRHNEYFINPQIMRNKKKNDYMELFGKFLANSIVNNYLLGINFSSVFIKLLFGESITFQDMLSVLSHEDALKYKYLMNADSDIEDLEIYFSYIFNRKKGEIDMIPDGRNIQVTKQNVNQYLQLLPKFIISERYKEIIDSFRAGFNSVLQLDLIKKWIRSDEFWCMTAGVKEVTGEVVLEYIEIRGGRQTHHAWFRNYISQASQQILLGFLKFSTGSSSIDFYKSSKISVEFELQGDNPKKMPISHTCFKSIHIPAYKTFAVMKQLLDAAFLYCSQGFGFA